MASEAILNELKKQIARITIFKVEDLINRPAKWGEVNFEPIRTHLERSLGIVSQLLVLPVELLPDPIIQNISACVEALARPVEALDKFSIQSGDVTSQRNSLVAQISGQADDLLLKAAAWLPYLAYQRGDVDRNIQNLTNSVKAAEGLVTEAKEKIAARGTEIEEIIIKAREASAKAGAAVFTKDFDDAAEAQEGGAKTWLGITGIAALVTLAIAGCMWWWAEPGLDQGQLFQKLSTKLVILAVLLSATIWCGRNYKALKHLATINRHRASSIRTLQAFSAAASEVQTKDAVLLEATRAVFGNMPTGYIGDGGGDGDLKIVEVVRSIMPRSDKP